MAAFWPKRLSRFPVYRQRDTMDCGPSCLRMISKFHGKHYTLESLRERSRTDRHGVSLQALSSTAESLGFRTLSVTTDYETLANVELPCIAHWQRGHFVVVYDVSKKRVRVADPAHGSLSYSREEFVDKWMPPTGGTRCGASMRHSPATKTGWFRPPPDRLRRTSRRCASTGDRARG